MFITFSLHWLFCYLFLCDLRHIYHLPINLTVIRIKVIKVIKLMQGYLMRALRTSCQITHAALPMLAFMFVKMLCLCCGICRLWLKSGTWKYHGCTGRIIIIIIFFVLSDMSLSLLPKQLIATYYNSSVLYVMEKWLDYVSFFFLHKVNLEKPWEHFLFVKCFFILF